MMAGANGDRVDEMDSWDRHWRRFALSARINPAQAFRRRLILHLLGGAAAEPGATILDIGCGSGDLLAELAAHLPGAMFAGIDNSKTGLAQARRKLPRAELLQWDLTSAAEAPEPLRQWAGHAVCSEVLEHLDDPAGVLANAKAFIKPGGRLVITVPGGPMSAFDRHIGHRRHYTKALLGQVLLAAGFEAGQVAAAGFPMFNLYRLAVLLRGGRLIEDAGGAPGPLARTAMGLFRRLMRLTLTDTPWGWQIVAVVRKKD